MSGSVVGVHRVDVHRVDVDVLVVGCGPVGATLGNLLGALGLRTTIVERELDVYHMPRAAHFDGEIMRVFQSIGLAEAIGPCTATIAGMDFVNAAGEKLFGFVSPPGTGPSGWANDYMFYQPDLERALRAGLARHPSVTLCLGEEVTAVDDRTDHVTVHVRDCAAGTTRVISASYVVGTDGARSLVRTALGTDLFDYGFDQPWLVVDTFLRRPVELPTVAVQYCDPARPATFVPHGGTHRRWEIMAMPGDDLAELESPGRVAELLAPWVSPDDVDVIRAVVYTFHALVARDWYRGRVLIAGDSAHQMPPFLGQGMCAGIRDAANIAWKLAAVVAGGDPSLLDTYQSEREPHVRAVIEAAVAAGGIIQATDPELARQRDEMFAAAGPDAGPPGFELPPLGPGLHGVGGGVPVPQIDGSDADLGPGFTLVAATADVLARAASCRRPPGVATAVLPALAAWLAAHEADVALIRPDRYVFATARADGIDALLTTLPSASGLRG